MKLVVVESPYAGNITQNLRYARACMLDCLRRSEAPIASHVLYAASGCLDDLDHAERTLGINAGLAWAERADATIVFQDLGISRGMRLGIEHAMRCGRPIEYRRLGGEWAVQA